MTSDQANLSGILSLKEIAELAEVSRPTVSNWRRRKVDFPRPTSSSSPSKPLFDATEIHDWLRSNELLPPGWEKNAETLSMSSRINLLRADGLRPMDTAIFALSTLVAPASEPLSDYKTAWEESVAARLREVADEATRQAFHESINTTLSTVSPENLESAMQHARSLSPDSILNAEHVVIDALFGDAGRSNVGHFTSEDSVCARVFREATSNVVRSKQVASRDGKPLSRVLDPMCGIGTTLLQVAHDHAPVSTIGFDIDPRALAIASLRALIRGTNASFSVMDSLSHSSEPADLIVCEPTFGMRLSREQLPHTEKVFAQVLNLPHPRIRTADAAIIATCLNQLSPGGRAIVLTPLAPLFQPSYAKLRQQLVALNAIDTIVQLPSKMLTSTSIPTALWILRTASEAHDGDSISLIDASSVPAADLNLESWLTTVQSGGKLPVSHFRVTLADVVKKGGPLLPELFAEPQISDDAFTDFATQVASLGKAANSASSALEKFLKDKDAVHTTVELEWKKLDELIEAGYIERVRAKTKDLKEASADDIVAKIFEPYKRLDTPCKGSVASSDEFLTPNSVVVPRFETMPARVFCEKGDWIAPRFSAVLRTDDSMFLPEYLAACVNADFNKGPSSGVMIPNRSIREIKIPIISLDQQTKLVEVLGTLDLFAAEIGAVRESIAAVSTKLMNEVFNGA
ncbi:N-6 DNA methylase [Corynebacterium amycolatum]|uniref:N-6 DNA methylase n=1 Tax=Corynebacterium amycolatum TaxID=43765 RepID=UPI00254BB56E|nr:N-6 DNA methylase [Corynebacterium amycolatum]MDK8819788.1 N-6 DNA methylase [Corynebacterium amycolatum]